MPKPSKDLILASLIEREQVLSIRCIPCGKSRYLSPLETIASYGGLVSFYELRALLQARCHPGCQLIVEPSIRRADELVIKKMDKAG